MAALALMVGVALLGAWVRTAHAQAAPDPLVEEARRFAHARMPGADQLRVEVVPGKLDARLRLAPCEQVQTYLPTGVRLWGKSRVGLRCVKGVTNWNVYVPLTVNVYGRALVSTSALPAGHVLVASDLRQAEVNLAEDTLNPPLTDAVT